MRTILILAALFLIQSTEARSSPLDRCREWFSKVLLSRQSSPMSPETLEVWRRSFHSDGDFPSLAALRLADGDLLLAHVWSRLPPEITDVLQGLPPTQREAHRFLEKKLGSQLLTEVIRSKTFLSQLIHRFEDARSTVPFGQWIRTKNSELQAAMDRDPALKGRLETTFAAGLRKNRAENAWSRSGVVPLPVEKRDGKTYVRILGELRRARLVGKEWEILIPREQIRRPAWNPLESRRMTAIFQGGISPPAHYPATLGHDGNFYLLDGNHRFQIDGRKLVPVRIPDPPGTAPLRIMFDLIHHPQPKEEEKIKLLEGEMKWQDLLKDSPKAKEFLLQP